MTKTERDKIILCMLLKTLKAKGAPISKETYEKALRKIQE